MTDIEINKGKHIKSKAIWKLLQRLWLQQWN